jgi:hypothetical protein
MRNISKCFDLFVFICISASIIILPAELCAQETLEREIGVYYTVQKGDTLWDVSKRFSDSPWQWPDLWKENPYIANPHIINPGERLRLFHKKETDLIVEDIKKTEEDKVIAQTAESPKQISTYYSYPSIDSIGFIRKEPVSPSGSIFKVKDDKVLISVGDLLYIRPEKNSSFSPGAKYTIYRTLEPLIKENTEELIGYQHYLTGIVEIKKIEPLYVLAEVIRSFREIAVSDLLMPYNPKSVQIPVIESAPGIEGTIIATEEKRAIIGDNTVAFIDKGEADGVKPGQFYSIFYREKENISPKMKEGTYLAPVDFGKVFVLSSERATSSVIITRSDKSINIGAKIRSAVK